MYYEINVAKKTNPQDQYGRHFFATAPRSITNQEQLRQVLPEIQKAFPEPYYNITVSYHPDVEYGVNLETLKHEEK